MSDQQRSHALLPIPGTGPTIAAAGNVAAGAMWSSLETLGTQLLQFLAFVALARLLGPQSWGVVGVALILTSASDTLINEAGWIEALVQKADLERADLDSVFWLLVGSATATAIVIIVLAAPMAEWFGEPQLEAILPWLAWSVPLAAVGVVPHALLWRKLACRSLALRSLLGMLLAGVAGVATALAGGGIWSLVVFQLVQPGVEVLFSWVILPWRPGMRLSLPHLRRTFAFVSGVLGERVLLLTEALLPRILIGGILGPLAVANYTMARKILELGSKLLWAPVSRVAMPTFIALAGDPGRARDGLVAGVGLTALVSFPAFVGLAVIVPELVVILFGPAWNASVPAIRIAVLVGPTLPLTWLLSAFLMAHGDARSVLLLGAIGTALFAVLLLLLPRMSVEGVLGVLLARSYMMLPLRLAWVARVGTLDGAACLRIARGPALAAVLMAGACIGLRSLLPAHIGPGSRICLSVLGGAVIYSAALVCLAGPLLRSTGQLAQRSGMRPWRRAAPASRLARESGASGSKVHG